MGICYGNSTAPLTGSVPFGEAGASARVRPPKGGAQKGGAQKGGARNIYEVTNWRQSRPWVALALVLALGTAPAAGCAAKLLL